MKITNFIKAAALAAVALYSASCAKDDLSDGGLPLTGEEVTVNLNYSVLGLASGDGSGVIDPLMRTAPTDLEPNDGASLKIENMFVIQFAGNSASSQMVGAPRFMDKDDLAAVPLSVPLIQNSNNCYTLFVANIPEGRNYNWNMSTESTFADVIKRVKQLSGEGDSYVTVGSEKTLIVSDVVDSPVVPGTTLTPRFKRSVAKLSLALKLENADMAIKSVRLRNVATTMVYADAALSKSGITNSMIYPTDVAVADYPVVTAGMPANGETKTFSWYVPRNQRGINASSTDATYKTRYAPSYATYFEIVAVKTDGSATSVFRVYPGANETNDYNISANNHYTIGLTVKGIGNGEMDSRIEDFKDVSYVDNGGYGSKSNAFIINPAPAGGGVRHYDIPVSQVNRFWGGSTPGYGNNPANVIGASDQWTVDLIWSDINGLFSKVVSTTEICLVNNNGPGLGIGTGPDQFFRLSVPAGMPDGNFTLGIKKAGGEYLWSWHFWVTEYNPDKFNRATIAAGKYTYPVPGGQVERYANGTTAAYNTYWSVKYANCVMMDRSLGMVSKNYHKQPATNLQGMLHYQFGRKDPFPMADVTTDSKAIALGHSTATVLKSVQTPNVFYNTNISTTYNWCTEVTGTGYIWNDPAATDQFKSIYDPCPPGWRLPANGVWDDFNRQVNGALINSHNPLRDLAWNYGRGIGSVVANVNGIRYWPGTTDNASVEGSIFYPATGGRNYQSGTLSNVGSFGYYWSDTPNSATSGYNLYFNGTAINPQSSNSRANGFAARCVAEFF